MGSRRPGRIGKRKKAERPQVCGGFIFEYSQKWFFSPCHIVFEPEQNSVSAVHTQYLSPDKIVFQPFKHNI